jgi:hypothetical protein
MLQGLFITSLQEAKNYPAASGGEYNPKRFNQFLAGG